MDNRPSSRLTASFRDPAGFLFRQDGVLYRQINQVYAPHLTHLLASGLYQTLVEQDLLVSMTAAPEVTPYTPALAHQVYRPEPIPFISYPYEWCFGQLKAAALATLHIQRRALAHDMWLKDASAYNIQWRANRPILIDALSFERLSDPAAPGPWPAYRQFCQHFLAPLALMAWRDVRLSQLLRTYLDGIPLDLTSRLLPWRSRLNWACLAHIHLHAAAQRRYADRPSTAPRYVMRRHQLIGLIDSLESAVRRLHWRAPSAGWAAYAAADSYTPAALTHKEKLVADFLRQADPATVWDLGANTGRFSHIAAQQGRFTLAFDGDPGAVEAAYQAATAAAAPNLLPLWLDVTNPSPSLGWAQRERDGWRERGPADLIMALALLHHLAIGNNLPLADSARFFGELAPWLILEFVPKSDPQAQRLLATRPDIFPDYTQAGLEEALGACYDVRRCEPLPESARLLYLLERRPC